MNEKFSFAKEGRLGIAVSGGLDSMTLVDLLYKGGYNISLLHCNFGLRGDESDQDQAFVEVYAKTNNLPLRTIQFDTKTYAKANRLSTQMAARELRYNWFKDLYKKGEIDYAVTAHHANDSAETLLINLSRGSGISGLVGIPAVYDRSIRPLLSFTRRQIEAYAKDNDVSWREDSSNATDAYLRNAIRHNVIPELEALSPDFVGKVLEAQNNLRESQKLLRDYMLKLKEEIIFNKDSTFVVKLSDIKMLSSPKGFLFEWLNPFGFTAWGDIYDLLTAQSGKQILSPKFILTKDRDTLILSIKTKKTNTVVEVAIDKPIVTLEAPISLVFDSVIKTKQNSLNEIAVDADLLTYPLVLRHWQNGDRFYPVGMKGSKKVSDYFTDLKISRPEKEKIWLLCSDQKIVWIIGYRADNRFEVSPSSKNTLVITYSP